MLGKTLKSLFNGLAAPYRGDDCLVNYVWINMEPDRADRKAKCSVSLKHLDRAYMNARYYPDARFKIWVDFRFLDERSRTCLREHAQRFAPANAALCDLNDIAPYHNDKLFAPDGAALKSVWPRVDYARLIVLEHVLKTEPQRYALYADFDVTDVRLRAAVEKMEQYGTALATTGASRFFGGRLNIFEGMLENGYYAFRKGSEAEKLLKSLRRKTGRAAGVGQNGFGPFTELVGEWAKTHKTPTSKMTIPRVLYDMGYEIPDKRCYKEWQWN
jgi:hypothetical protein